MPHRWTDTVQVLDKDAFMWDLDGAYAPTLGSGAEIYKLVSLRTGQNLAISLLGSPPNEYSKYRSFLAFNTSGYDAPGHVESVSITLRAQQIWNLRDHLTDDQDFGYYRPYSLDLYTVRGKNIRNSAYNSGYGFGDTVVSGAWGQTAFPMTTLNELAGSLPHSVMVEQALAQGATGISYAAGENLPYYISNKTITVDIPSTSINFRGESHFRLVTNRDLSNSAPGTANTVEAAEYIVYGGELGSIKPEIVINYVVPSGYQMEDLRKTDLSIQRNLRDAIDQNVTFSGAPVIDGYPDDPAKFSNERNIAVEHESTVEDPIEIGSTAAEVGRLFTIDVVCDREGELQDLTNLVYEILDSPLDFWDFNYGFVNPPKVGPLQTENIEIIPLEPLVVNDVRKYHMLVTFETKILRSGA